MSKFCSVNINNKMIPYITNVQQYKTAAGVQWLFFSFPKCHSYSSYSVMLLSKTIIGKESHLVNICMKCLVWLIISMCPKWTIQLHLGENCIVRCGEQIHHIFKHQFGEQSYIQLQRCTQAYSWYVSLLIQISCNVFLIFLWGQLTFKKTVAIKNMKCIHFNVGKGKKEYGDGVCLEA